MLTREEFEMLKKQARNEIFFEKDTETAIRVTMRLISIINQCWVADKDVVETKDVILSFDEEPKNAD